jgi:predicted dehydrogenase
MHSVEKTINWGILATGRIARKFVQGLRDAPGARALAVGSRSRMTAEKFGEDFGIPHRYGRYQDLVADPELDVIYISSPHTFHFEHSKLALDAGKAVLCEKPFTVNAAEARQLVHEARQRNLFLMEGMWTRFFPIMHRLRELLADRVIGNVHTLIADAGIRRSAENKERLFRMDLGGGALLDLGVYPVSLASMVFGSPDRFTAMAQLGDTGVDERLGITLGYPDGAIASLYTAIKTESPKEAILLGTKGSIRIHGNFITPTRLTLSRYGQAETFFEEELTGNGMHYEAMEVMHRLNSGSIESPLMPLDESVRIMETLDAIRSQIGLIYPSEYKG